MAKGFDVLVLNKDFEIINVLNYSILQWTRKYYESGSFSIYIPIESYTSDMKYVYSKDREEIGNIEQVNYYIDTAYKYVIISGYFLENELNRRVVFGQAKYINYSISDQPVGHDDVKVFKGKASEVAISIFNYFRELSILDPYTQNYLDCNLDIEVSPNSLRNTGKNSEHTRGNEYLGNKIYTVLKPSAMSYRVYYDFDTQKKYFKIWKGKNRSSGNGVNNPIVFSTKYGNIVKADLLKSETDYKNCFAFYDKGIDEDDSVTILGYKEEAETDTNKNFIFFPLVDTSADRSTQRLDYIKELFSVGSEKLNDYKKILSIDIDTIESSYEYLTDFNLGDICSVEIPELELSTNAVISGIYEVVKEGVWTMTLEFTI